jgi:ABC-type transport system involved in cytochrome bd biosynthesis fused ATPase/permease subunit
MILLMDDGRVIERGSHERLMRDRGAYYEMVLRQMESSAVKGDETLIVDELVRGGGAKA